MSTLTNLSDAELDAVTGGFFNTSISVIKIATNLSLSSQAQENVAVLALASQGGAQLNENVQTAIA